MDALVVTGGRRLKGRVRASGAKNAALPIMAAAILADGPVRLKNVPNLADIRTMSRLLRELGVRVEREEKSGDLVLQNERPARVVAPYSIMRTMRAGFCVLGPLVARRGRAEVSLPGGCAIGDRPVDLHLKGMRALGAKVEVKHGYVFGSCRRLRGAEMYLGGPFGSTVTGTANVLMAAVLARGTTVIDCAACEPEVQDLARMLVKMGAGIRGIGSPRLLVEGVDRLSGAEHAVIPDRIEAGTFLLAAAATGGDVAVEGARWNDLFALVHLLREAGAEVEHLGDAVRVRAPRRLRSVDVTTLPFPGFPTDLQAQTAAMLAVADGISVITEKIYPDRFMHVAELNRMGAAIRKEGPAAVVHGPRRLSGAPVMASDLRASAALVVAALVAEGRTTVSRVYHLDRGYERLEQKLKRLGARVRRIKES
ncbi:MAG: UDP-N-acetylglucosamine 1-carboxyvinyltransferase [Planctomycetes bacterium]|nr:UDP-N-acetylglucosamine 1-carboxyvinyltransferase [Planctomycetota bacterium]